MHWDRDGLTYDEAERILSENDGMPIGDVLRCCGDDDPSADLLSDQCHTSVRLQRGNMPPIFWRGCILGQYMDVMSALDSANPAIRLRRHCEYTNVFPRAAVLEAIGNALIHCDAAQRRCIEVSMGERALTVTSPGCSMVRGEGRMLPRNQALAVAMVSLGWASMRSTGMMTIMDSYRRTWSVPRAEDSVDSFVVTLPALNEDSKNPSAVAQRIYDPRADGRGHLQDAPHIPGGSHRGPGAHGGRRGGFLPRIQRQLDVLYIWVKYFWLPNYFLIIGSK